MEILEVAPTDEANLKKFSSLAGQVYADDPVWVPQSEAAVLSLMAMASSIYIRPLLYIDHGIPLARAVAILYPNAVDNQKRPVGYIGFFECLIHHPEAGCAILNQAEHLLCDQGAVLVQAPRVDNLLMGLLMEGFHLPQTILSPHNPPYYAELLLSNGYRIQERLYTYTFTRSSAIKFPISLPGFRTRTFNRQQLDEETENFHFLQHEIFSSHPGWIPRNLDEDRRMIENFLYMLDDELVIIAENKDGHPVGLLVCLPDVYQTFRGQVIDRARLISIGVLPAYTRKGVGILMGLHLARSLLAKGYQTLEASWIRDANLPPQNLSLRFLGKRGREYALFVKNISCAGGGGDIT